MGSVEQDLGAYQDELDREAFIRECAENEVDGLSVTYSFVDIGFNLLKGNRYVRFCAAWDELEELTHTLLTAQIAQEMEEGTYDY